MDNISIQWTNLKAVKLLMARDRQSLQANSVTNFVYKSLNSLLILSVKAFADTYRDCSLQVSRFLWQLTNVDF